MANIIKRESWHIPEKQVTPEHIFFNRRRFLRQMGFTGAGLLTASALTSCSRAQEPEAASVGPAGKPDYRPDWRLSDEETVFTYNNFYEFSTSKTAVHRLVDKFVTKPWPLEIGGLCENPMKVDAEELIDDMTLEERIYRFRCVEAWAMIVPWTGFELRELIKKAKPKPEAKFVRFETFYRPDQAPGFKDQPNYPWPYTEGLRLDEAMHPLTLGVSGIYGKPLPKQCGAPLRIVVPWKYGYKSIKSIVKIEFTAEQPATLWETLQPDEYPFESNVDPGVPHPRWSQATERMIDTGNRVPTQKYNGYADQVAKLYA